MFCNPAEKTHAGVVYPVQNRRAHLTCYEILDHATSPMRSTTVTNQLGTGQAQLYVQEVLCVPTRKGKRYTEEALVP
jgi:hypothetical protein